MRMRYTASRLDREQATQVTPRLKAALESWAPFQEIYIDWVTSDSPMPTMPPDGYPFRVERDAGSLPSFYIRRKI